MGILRKATSVLIGLMIAGCASATMISFDSKDDYGTVYYGGNIDGTDVDGLSASTSFELTGVNDSSLVFEIELKNTSTSLWESSRVSRIGFNIDSEVTSVTASSPWVAVLDKNKFPNNFGELDICIKGEDEGNCTGGPGGVEIGGSATFSLELFFNTLPAVVNLDNFGVRWQSLDSEALDIRGDSGTGTPISKVPEPGTLGLFGLAVLGISMAGRRRLQRS